LNEKIPPAKIKSLSKNKSIVEGPKIISVKVSISFYNKKSPSSQINRIGIISESLQTIIDTMLIAICSIKDDNK